LAEMNVQLRSASMDDWSMIRGWLAQPAIQEWWGPLTQTEGAVLAAMKSDHALVRIIEVDEQPVGYAHAVDATLWGEQLPDDLPPGTWDLDLFVAEPGMRNKGIGSAALRLLKQDVFDTTLAVAVCVFPAITNEHAVRAYEKAGFIWQSVWNNPKSGPSWFMIAGRDQA